MRSSCAHLFFVHPFLLLLPCPPHPSPGDLRSTLSRRERQPAGAGFWGQFWTRSPHRKRGKSFFLAREKRWVWVSNSNSLTGKPRKCSRLLRRILCGPKQIPQKSRRISRLELPQTELLTSLSWAGRDNCTWAKPGRFGSLLVLCFLALGGHCLQILCLPGFGTHANTQHLPYFRAFPASIQEHSPPKCLFFMAKAKQPNRPGFALLQGTTQRESGSAQSQFRIILGGAGQGNWWLVRPRPGWNIILPLCIFPWRCTWCLGAFLVTEPPALSPTRGRRLANSPYSKKITWSYRLQCSEYIRIRIALQLHYRISSELVRSL